MAEGENQEKGDTTKGFAGLSSMVSDVDSTVAQIGRESKPAAKATHAPAPAERAPSAEDQEPERLVHQAPAQSSGGSSTGKWLLGIGMVAGLLWFVSLSGDKTSSPVPVFTPSGNSSSIASPSPSSQPAPSPPVAPKRPSEEKPPVGINNVLTYAQLRYCVAEEIRLDAAKEVINNYNGTHVNRFNEMAADYNGRCGQFRYRSGALDGAKAEVERFRGVLEADGRGRFIRGKAAPSQDLTFVPVEPAPDPTVKAIQERLNELGYDAGPADGLMGGKTRAAIVAFQKKSSLPQNGSASAELLQTLKQWHSSQHLEPTNPPAVLGGRVSESPVTARPSLPPPLPPSNRSEQRESQDLAGLSPFESAAIERSCDGARRIMGPGAYYECLKRELSSLRSSGGRPDLSVASSTEREAIERSCDGARRIMGPGAYYECLKRELSSLRSSGGRPDMSMANTNERDVIERSCDGARRIMGPGAYYECLKRELSSLRSSGGRPDMSMANTTERDAIERSCDGTRQVMGPGAYYECLKRELSSLRSSGGRPDLSVVSSTEREAIEQSCDGTRRVMGPGSYYGCLRRELSQLGYR